MRMYIRHTDERERRKINKQANAENSFLNFFFLNLDKNVSHPSRSFSFHLSLTYSLPSSSSLLFSRVPQNKPWCHHNHFQYVSVLMCLFFTYKNVIFFHPLEEWNNEEQEEEKKKSSQCFFMFKKIMLRKKSEMNGFIVCCSL